MTLLMNCPDREDGSRRRPRTLVGMKGTPRLNGITTSLGAARGIAVLWHKQRPPPQMQFPAM